MLNAVSEVSSLDLSALPIWTTSTPRRSKLPAAIRHIELHFTERLRLEDLASVAGLSLFRFVTVFRREMGISPHRYLCARRVRAAQDLLRKGIPPAIVAIEVGFCDQSHLCRHFRAVCGMTPGQFLATVEPAGASA